MDNEMKDLAARMAADEASEGNYAAAAELQAAATSPLEQCYPGIQDQLHRTFDGLAPTGPLTPGQVMCRVCQLDDRTRAASNPDDLLCTVCRANEPNRIREQRRIALRAAAARFLGFEDADDTTAAGSAEMDLIQERVDTLMRLADLVEGHPLPYSLVNAAEGQAQISEVPGHVTDGRESDADAARRFAGQCLELQKRVDVLEANEHNRRFIEKALDRLRPQLARRIADVITPPLNVSEDEVRGWSKLQIDEWAAIQRAAREAAERLVERGLRFVPSDAEVELAQKHLRFIVATTYGQPFLREWDGRLYDRPNDPQARGELTVAREDLVRQRAQGISTDTDPGNWGVFGLVRVPDETVFGKEPGPGCYPPVDGWDGTSIVEADRG